jgi:uncharacterized protein YndB with AHSA1/START domain
MSGSKFVYVTYIRITPEKLWYARTTPEIIKQYRFGMSVESEWKVGSTCCSAVAVAYLLLFSLQ